MTCLKGNVFSENRWTKGYCAGIVAALIAFDHEGKRLAEALEMQFAQPLRVMLRLYEIFTNQRTRKYSDK